MTASPKWDDLAVRLGSAAALAIVALLSMWIGGDVFHVFIAVACGMMVWETVRMIAPAARREAVILGVLAGVALMVAWLLPEGLALPLLFLPAFAGLGLMPTRRRYYVPFTVLIVLAGWGLASLRDDFGFSWMLWLALVVVVTDVFGYFAGRTLGGPKFWPRVSPKKTWSGTVAGWIAAAFVGLAWMVAGEAGVEIIGISIALSMASQMGDIAESAMKRRMGVKDSSNVLPGHGGVFDRFDGMLGASMLLLVATPVVDFPPPPIL